MDRIGEYVLARNLCRDKNEKVVVVADKKKLGIAKRFLPDDGEMVVFEGLSRHGEEPPEFVAEAMASADIFMLITDKSLSHTKARIEATKNGARGFSSPGIEEYMMEAMMANPENLAMENEKLIKAATGYSLRAYGDDWEIAMEIGGREWVSDDGLLCSPGSFGNLPAGEIFIAPVEFTASGEFPALVFGKPSMLSVRDGKLVEAPESLMEILGEDGRVLGEFGIGTNPLAKIHGNILIDEKVMGTAHIAFGTNISFGGKIDAGVHVDVIIENPSIEVDGRKLMDNGKAVA